MRSARFLTGLLASVFFIGLVPAVAQSLPQPEDPLARIRAAAQANAQGGGAEACAATGESLCEQVAPKIIASAQGESPLAENLRRFASDVGGGAPETRAARGVAWGVAAFRDSGLEVHTEKFQVPVTWSEGASHLEILSPSRIPVQVAAVGWSPATPPGGIEARVVFAGQGNDIDFTKLGPAAKGAILLIHSDVFSNWSDLSEEYARAPAVVRRAAAAGAAAILWMSTRERELMYRRVNSLTGQLDPLPQAIVARGDAVEFERVLAAGQKIRARLDLPNHIGGPAERENVVAEIRGREAQDEWVLLGASLHSEDFGAEALGNNACSAALVVEAARDILRTGIRPRRSIRFVLFTAEEQGMLGSWAYVRTHRAELDRARAAIIFGKGIADDCVGPVTGYSLGGRQDVKFGLVEAVKPAEPLGVAVHTFDAPLDTGNFDFLLEGVPTLLANQDETNHTPGDRAASTVDKMDLQELRRNTAIAGVTAFGVAERAAPLGRRQNRPGIEALLKETGLDQQMKNAGLWPLWESGERGRLP